MAGIQGFVVFCLGIVVSIMGAAKVPAEGSKWPDTLPLFAVGALVAVVGLVLWRKGTAKAASEQARATESDNDPEALLRSLIAPLRELGEELGELNTAAVTGRVDELLNRYVLPLAEVRNVLVKRLGMEKGAEILVIVAYGERLLNRVWSAAADGHLPEARACYPEAVEAFEEAAKLVGTEEVAPSAAAQSVEEAPAQPAAEAVAAEEASSEPAAEAAPVEEPPAEAGAPAEAEAEADPDPS